MDPTPGRPKGTKTNAFFSGRVFAATFVLISGSVVAAPVAEVVGRAGSSHAPTIQQGEQVQVRAGQPLNLRFLGSGAVLKLRQDRSSVLIGFAGTPPTRLRIKPKTLRGFVWGGWVGVHISAQKSTQKPSQALRDDAVLLHRRGRTILLNAVDLEYLQIPRNKGFFSTQQPFPGRPKAAFKVHMYLLRKFNEHRT